MAPPDPILGVSEAFKKETSPDKLNLVGAGHGCRGGNERAGGALASAHV